MLRLYHQQSKDEQILSLLRLFGFDVEGAEIITDRFERKFGRKILRLNLRMNRFIIQSKQGDKYMKENRQLEYKEKLSNSFLKTVSAFANYDGGIILFGVNDSGEVVGIRSEVLTRSKTTPDCKRGSCLLNCEGTEEVFCL